MSAPDRYEDIISLPHHQSEEFPHMSLEQRAAQFSPFAALKGYEDEIGEAQRTTEERRSAGEADLDAFDALLTELKSRLGERPCITVTYFVPDARKEGGSYLTLTGGLKKIDEQARKLILSDGTVLSLDDILSLREI